MRIVISPSDDLEESFLRCGPIFKLEELAEVYNFCKKYREERGELHFEKDVVFFVTSQNERVEVRYPGIGESLRKE